MSISDVGWVHYRDPFTRSDYAPRYSAVSVHRFVGKESVRFRSGHFFSAALLPRLVAPFRRPTGVQSDDCRALSGRNGTTGDFAECNTLVTARKHRKLTLT